MTNRCVVFSSEARDELFDASDYYREKNPKVAERFEADVQHLVERIAQSPESFAFEEEPVRLAIMTRFPYYLPFAEVADVIYVLGICHGSRRPGYWKERE